MNGFKTCMVFLAVYSTSIKIEFMLFSHTSLYTYIHIVGYLPLQKNNVFCLHHITPYDPDWLCNRTPENQMMTSKIRRPFKVPPLLAYQRSTLQNCFNQLTQIFDGYVLSKSLKHFQASCWGSFLSFQIFSRPSFRFVSGLWRRVQGLFRLNCWTRSNQPCSNRATKRPSKNSSMISSCAARFSPLGAPAWAQHSKEDHPNYTKWFGSMFLTTRICGFLNYTY